MNNEEILQKTLEKARSNVDLYMFSKEYIFQEHGSFEEWIEDERYFSIIFNHDFAFAFWGEATVTYIPLNWTRDKDMNNFDWQDYELKLPAWKYHLKLMVIEKEPLRYLEKFLK